MRTFLMKSIMRQLISQFFILTLAPIIILGYISFHYSKAALKDHAFNNLSTIREIKKRQINNYLRERLANIKILSESPDIRNAFELLRAYHDEGGGEPQGPYNTASKKYTALYEKINPYFKEYKTAHRYHDSYLICASHGHILYTSAKESDLGSNLKTGLYSESGLALLWRKVLKDKHATMVDFSNYGPTNKPAAFIGAPAFDNKGDIYAVVALQLNPKEINAIMQERIGMGRTGETYIVGPDFLMRNNPSLEQRECILKKNLNTDAARSALQNRQGIKIITNYQGVKVLSSFSPCDLKKELNLDFDWAIISEIDVSEAFSPIGSLKKLIILIGLLLAVVACLLGYCSARSIADPLKNLSQKASLISEGDLTVAIPTTSRSDEVGVLIRTFHTMVETLRYQTQDLMECANQLASSISQISTTSSELAASASETSTSLNEITTTVKEVRQTAQISSEKAAQVAESAKRSSDIYHTGKKATEDAIKGMKRIKDEMEYIAEGIVKLSEQTQSIGEIINTVNDLADQSNLLAVNASIEASKAGEHGKGFVVVAQEVKSLADQSKEATNQVRSILNEIQKATSAAVMATERGSKAVEAGMNLSDQTSNAVCILSESIKNAESSSIQIAASSQEQLIGMEQLNQAMESIKEAGSQNLSSAKQLGTASMNMEKLGQNLKDMARKFRV
ncbi:MAG: methyl-accepting chemotaxis protein [bacterium]